MIVKFSRTFVSSSSILWYGGQQREQWSSCSGVFHLRELQKECNLVLRCWWDWCENLSYDMRMEMLLCSVQVHYNITRGDFLFENAKWLNAKRGGKLYNNCWKLKFLQPFFSAPPNHVIWASLGTQNTAFILLYFHIILVSHFLLSSIVIVGLLKEQQ